MFEFLDMMGNYEARNVNNYSGKDCEGNDFVLDTSLVTDATQPYETAVSHPFYNGSDWIILESYDTKEEAKKGHNKWFNIFVNEQLPSLLYDHVTGGFEGALNDETVRINRK